MIDRLLWICDGPSGLRKIGVINSPVAAPPAKTVLALRAEWSRTKSGGCEIPGLAIEGWLRGFVGSQDALSHAGLEPQGKVVYSRAERTLF